MQGKSLVTFGALIALVLTRPLAADVVDIFATKADYRDGVMSPMLVEPAPGEPRGGPVCNELADVASLPFNISGNTTGATNSVPSIPIACNGNYTSVNGPDDVYVLELGPGNNVTFSLTTPSADYDPSIYLLGTCDDGASCLVGADDCFAANAGGNPCGASSDESFNVSGLTPGTYFFYVDSFYSGPPRNAGPYDLEITGTLGTFPRDIGGTVSGLLGTGLVLQNNGGDDLPIAADGPFTFATQVDDGDDYDVTVLTQPGGPNQVCTVTNGSGTVAGADVTDVEVDCVMQTHTIGGTVNGLVGTGLVLQNNGGDDLPIAGDGPFTFATPIDDGEDYDVTVLTQPGGPSQVCTVTNGSGTVAGADVTDVQVDCALPGYTIGGTVSGLAGTGLVLQNNGGDDLPIAANGAFTFATPVTDGEDYDVTVLTQPGGPNQVCTVTNGSGTVAGADVTDVEVDCVTDTHTIGGTVSGLAGTGLVLQNNGGDDLPIAGDGPFTFATPVADGSGYAVTVLTQPSGPNQVCTVANGNGTVAGADVTDVEVTCATDTYSVGGTVSGLTGTGLVLQINGGDDLPIAGDGPFTFPTALADGTAYTVTVLVQPSDPAQFCTVSNASGTVSGDDVIDLEVECVTGAPESVSIDMFGPMGLVIMIMLLGLLALVSIRMYNVGS